MRSIASREYHLWGHTGGGRQGKEALAAAMGRGRVGQEGKLLRCGLCG
jgi:hypothetical protein